MDGHFYFCGDFRMLARTLWAPKTEKRRGVRRGAQADSVCVRVVADRFVGCVISRRVVG